MKAKDFGSWLSALSDSLSQISPDRANAIDSVRRIFEGRGTMTVAAVLKAARPELGDNGGFGARVGEVHDTLEAFQPFVQPAAKKGYVDDLRAFIGFLGPFRQARVGAFVDAVCAQLEKKPAKATKAAATRALRQPLVDRYVDELRAAHTHDDAFREVYRRLESDRAVRALEAAAIASAFAYETAKSTARKESLRRIWRRQEVFERASDRFGPKRPAA